MFKHLNYSEESHLNGKLEYYYELFKLKNLTETPEFIKNINSITGDKLISFLEENDLFKHDINILENLISSEIISIIKKCSKSIMDGFDMEKILDLKSIVVPNPTLQKMFLNKVLEMYPLSEKLINDFKRYRVGIESCDESGEYYDNEYIDVWEFVDSLTQLAKDLNKSKNIFVVEQEHLIRMNESENEVKYFKQERDYLYNIMSEMDIKPTDEDFSYYDTFCSSGDGICYFEGQLNEQVVSILDDILPTYSNAYIDSYNECFEVESINYNNKSAYKWAFSEGILAYGIDDFTFAIFILMFGGMKENEN